MTWKHLNALAKMIENLPLARLVSSLIFFYRFSFPGVLSRRPHASETVFSLPSVGCVCVSLSPAFLSLVWNVDF